MIRAAAIIVVAAGCSLPFTRTPAAPDPLVLGAFTDDYNASHAVSATEWRHGSRARYRIVKWNTAGQYFIAQNDTANPGDGGLWSRVDWLRLEGMPPWTWGYCLTAYKAPTADSAEATRIANRSTPRTGCNGFPFTRMRSAQPAGRQ